MKRVALLASSLLLGLAVCGCSSDFDHVTIDNVKSPLSGSMNLARIEVPVGTIVTAHIVAYNENHDTMSVDLHTKDSSLLDVANVVSEHDYAFLGVKAGETEIEMRADGKLVLVFRAAVVNQPTPP